MRRGAAPAVAPEPAQRHVEVRDDLEGERRPKAAGDPAHSALAAPSQGCKSGISTSHVRAQSRSRAREQLGDGNLGALASWKQMSPPPAEPGSTLPAPQALLSAPKGLILPSGCVCGGEVWGLANIYSLHKREAKGSLHTQLPPARLGLFPLHQQTAQGGCCVHLGAEGMQKLGGVVGGRR